MYITKNNQNIEVVIKKATITKLPYHTVGVPTGLAFESGKQGYTPPSLRALESKLNDPIDFERTATEGVLWLNSALTVTAGNPNTHQKIWQPFTDAVIKELLSGTKGVVWILLGSHAVNKVVQYESLVKSNNHYLICSSHPSPYSAHKPLKQYPPFNDINHFDLANDILTPLGKSIQWTKQVP